VRRSVKPVGRLKAWPDNHIAKAGLTGLTVTGRGVLQNQGFRTRAGIAGSAGYVKIHGIGGGLEDR